MTDAPTLIERLEAAESDDPFRVFAYFVSRCASGLYKELLEKGRTDTEARNAVIHCFLDFASGEACQMRDGGAIEDDTR